MLTGLLCGVYWELARLANPDGKVSTELDSIGGSPDQNAPSAFQESSQ
jgi:hypothetical protein